MSVRPGPVAPPEHSGPSPLVDPPTPVVPTDAAERRHARAVGWGIAPISFVFSAAFGAYAVGVGMPAVAALAMSVLMFSGGAQMAMVSLAGAGAGLLPAATTGLLLNARYLLIGASVAPSLPGPWWKRVAAAATLNDPSWIYAVRSDGSVSRTRLLWSSLGQYIGWVAGTVVGVLLGPKIGSIETIGLDTVMPMFFVSLFVADLGTRTGAGRRHALRIAAGAAVVALALAPFAPAGVPVLVAVAVILLLGGRGPA